MNQTPEHEQTAGQTSSPAGSGEQQAPGAQLVSEQTQSGEAQAPGEQVSLEQQLEQALAKSQEWESEYLRARADM
ncbi:MAG: hypothetical protein ACK5BC_00180, partial [Burkholderiales bacterium]